MIKDSSFKEEFSTLVLLLSEKSPSSSDESKRWRTGDAQEEKRKVIKEEDEDENDVRILPCFREGDDGHEGLIEVEKKNLKKKEIQKKVRVGVPIDCTQWAVDNKKQRRESSSVCRQAVVDVDRLASLSTGLRRMLTTSS